MDFIPLSSRVVTPLSGSSWTALCSPFSSSRTRFWSSLTPRLGRVSSSGTMASSLRAALRDPFLIWFTFLLWAQGQTLAYRLPCRFCVLRPPVPKCPCARSKPEVLGKLVASYVAVLVLASFGVHITWHRLCVQRPLVSNVLPQERTALFWYSSSPSSCKRGARFQDGTVQSFQ